MKKAIAVASLFFSLNAHAGVAEDIVVLLKAQEIKTLISQANVPFKGIEYKFSGFTADGPEHFALIFGEASLGGLPTKNCRQTISLGSQSREIKFLGELECK